MVRGVRFDAQPGREARLIYFHAVRLDEAAARDLVSARGTNSQRRGFMNRIFCRLLIALMIWTPYQVASAGMIATDESFASRADDRAAITSFLARSEVAGELQALGIDAASARARVAAMSETEVRSLAGTIADAPAG